jgi:glycine/D-amino acid oxidase-like deaminating enzyme
VVVGAGFTGLACARRLSELFPSQHILVLDARELAQNASGRNSGFAVAVSDYSNSFDPTSIAEYQRINRINDAGISNLRALVATHSIDCQWREDGFYRTAADQQALRGIDEFAEYLRALDIAHTALSATELSAHLGTNHYQAGIKIDSGALLQPAALIYGLADSLPEGVSLHENTPVLHIGSGKKIMLDLPDGQIETDNLVLATNYELPKLGVSKARLVGSTLATSCTRILTDEEIAQLGSETSWACYHYILVAQP